MKLLLDHELNLGDADMSNVDDFPKISVVTVVFNGEKFIERAIQSVISQNYHNLQYIIIDGGSTDGTVDVIKKYEDKLYFWVSEKDKGISDAFNKGIAQASGDVIGLLNSDDWYENNVFYKIAEAYKKNNKCVIHGRVRFWSDENTPYYEVGGNDEIMDRLMSVMHPTVFVPKEVYDRYGVFDLAYKRAMDYELMLRFKKRGVCFSYIDEVVANMARGGVSDCHWFATQKEVFVIREKHGIASIKNVFWVVSDVIKIFIRQNLEKAGFDRVVSFYRKIFSRLDKVKL